MVFVVVSLAWGLAAGSQMIVFDGLYSLVGIGLSAVSVAAQRTVAKGADASYPWGRETWEPVVLGPRTPERTVESFDAIRADIDAQLNARNYHHSTSVVFTADRHWVEWAVT